MTFPPLTRGPCPVCERPIMDERKTAYLPDGMEFTVKFTDGTFAAFSICSACYETLTPEQAERLVRRQIVNWGAEIEQMLRWFYTKACHLEAERWAKTKAELVEPPQEING